MPNWHDRHRTPYDREHERELQKHEPRPSDRGFSPPTQSEPPARYDVPISTAMDIALIVRGLKNLPDAAALIERYAERYANAKADAERMDAVAAGAGR